MSQLEDALREIERLRKENGELKRRLGLPDDAAQAAEMVTKRLLDHL